MRALAKLLGKATLRASIMALAFIVGVACIMILIAILIAMPLMIKTPREIRERALQDTLQYMRDGVKRYEEIHGTPPHTLEDMVSDKILPRIPIDPITANTNWQVITGTKLIQGKTVSGVIDVHSTSKTISSKGTPYNTW